MVDLNSMRTCECARLDSRRCMATANGRRYKRNDNRHHHVTHKMKFLVIFCSPVQLNPLEDWLHTHTHQTFYFIFPSLDVSLFRIRPRHLYGCWLFEAEINLESEMDLRLPNFREIFVFHSVHKTFPLWRCTTNDATPWRSRTGTPLQGTAFDMWIKIRRDSERKRIYGNKFRFVLLKIWMRTPHNEN